ncbi:MAG: glutamate-cysteine ligase family protein [Methanoregulaceae archaeon]|nr:glutamate-cysteine ligase family protein [Methanoregulaceae archaeon]
MSIGTEHEFSVNDPGYFPAPVSDLVIQDLSGRIEGQIPFCRCLLSKELQKTVLEFIPGRPGPVSRTGAVLQEAIDRFHARFRGRYALLGLGMHPTARLDQTRVWDHDEGEYYAVYDRLFSLRQHGWLNIQALQMNLPYRDEADLVAQYNRVRSLLPYLVAVTAASPLVEGRLTGTMDTRLVMYRENQRQIPLICNGIVPEKINRLPDYLALMEEIYHQLRRKGADILCEEWVNSSGVIVRFTRPCIEIKALDEQECVRSDMAAVAFVSSLMRAKIRLEEDRDELLALTETAIRRGTAGLKPELLALCKEAEKSANSVERRYLPLIRKRAEEGSLAELVADRVREQGCTDPVIRELGMSLRNNIPFTAGS